MILLIVILWILLAATVLDYLAGWLDATMKAVIETLGGE